MMLKIEKTDEKLTPLDGEKINLRGRQSNKTWKMAVLTQKHAFVHIRNDLYSISTLLRQTKRFSYYDLHFLRVRNVWKTLL